MCKKRKTKLFPLLDTIFSLSLTDSFPTVLLFIKRRRYFVALIKLPVFYMYIVQYEDTFRVERSVKGFSKSFRLNVL